MPRNKLVFFATVLIRAVLALQAAGAEAADVPLSYVATGIATAQKQLQLNGKGIDVAIIDTGVDYASSNLFGSCAKSRAGGAAGRTAFQKSAGCRITAARDFVGDVSLEKGTFKPDNDPMDCRSPDGSHGTSVASIAVGDASHNVPKGGKPWRGVAYAAGVKAYKIAGLCSDAGVNRRAAVLAINQASSTDSADVLNLSFGPDFRVAAWRDAQYVPALTQAINKQGTLVSVAAGNDGVFGPFMTDNSITPPHIISVAAGAVLTMLPAAELRFNQPVSAAGSNTMAARSSMLMASAMKSEADAVVRKMASMKLPLQVIPAQPLLACGPSLANKAAVRGRVLLIMRGGCKFTVKADAAAAAGAAAVLLFNNQTDMEDEKAEDPRRITPLGFSPALLDAPRIPVWGLSHVAGQALLKAAAKKGGLKLVGLQLKQQHMKVQAVISRTSSAGPPATLELLPTITAVGEDVRVAEAGNTFSVETGTSLASPMVAGSLALLKQARPDLFTQQPGAGQLPAGGRTNQAAAYNAVVATAKPLQSVMYGHEKGGWAEPVSRAGAGLLQLDAAIRNPTVLKPNYFQLRSNRPSQTLTFTAANTGQHAVTYKLGHRPAAAVDIGRNSWLLDVPELLQVPLAASASFTVAGRAVSEVTVRPGGSTSVQASFRLPHTLMAAPLLYSGYLTLTPKQQQPAAASAVVERAAQRRPAMPHVTLAAVPLVLPYQGFSQNYTTLSILPTPDPELPDTARLLQGLLNVCYADYVETYKYVEGNEYGNQDGWFEPKQVDACLYSTTNPAAVKKLPLSKLFYDQGGLIAAAAMLRPGLSMRLMLFDAVPACGPKDKKCGTPRQSAASRFNRGALVGEVWRKLEPSKDLQQALWAYTGLLITPFGAYREIGNGRVEYMPVSRKRKYKMQLWIEGPVAAADRAAGERTHTFKYDVPGVFEFV